MAEGEGADELLGPSHLLLMQPRAAEGLEIDLSELSLEEIDALALFLSLVLAEARESCAYRDKIAEEAFQNGSDTYYRIYRSVPTVVER
jgi:hypothetical protein